MKFVFILLFLFCLVGCDLTISVEERPHHRAAKRSSNNASSVGNGQKIKDQKPGVLRVADESGILVTAAWMKRYIKMEERRGTIPADKEIWQEGENFRINSEVANHFSEMRIADSVQPEASPARNKSRPKS